MFYFRYQQSGCHWRDHHGSIVWFWSRQLPLHEHEHVHEEGERGGREQDREEAASDHGYDRLEEEEDSLG